MYCTVYLSVPPSVQTLVLSWILSASLICHLFLCFFVVVVCCLTDDMTRNKTLESFCLKNIFLVWTEDVSDHSFEPWIWCVLDKATPVRDWMCGGRNSQSHWQGTSGPMYGTHTYSSYIIRLHSVRYILNLNIIEMTAFGHGHITMKCEQMLIFYTWTDEKFKVTLTLKYPTVVFLLASI